MAQKPRIGLEVNLANLSILLADENDGGRRILKDILDAIGAKDVHSATSYEMAERYLKTERMDVFICDMHLGKDRGIELIKQVRSIRGHPNQKIPILLTCSHTRQREIQASRDSGTNMLLAKPYSVNALYDRLAWIAHKPRPFIYADGYKGPDRRFKDEDIEEADRRKAAEANGEANMKKAS